MKTKPTKGTTTKADESVPETEEEGLATAHLCIRVMEHFLAAVSDNPKTEPGYFDLLNMYMDTLQAETRAVRLRSGVRAFLGRCRREEASARADVEAMKRTGRNMKTTEADVGPETFHESIARRIAENGHVGSWWRAQPASFRSRFVEHVVFVRGQSASLTPADDVVRRAVALLELSELSALVMLSVLAVDPTRTRNRVTGSLAVAEVTREHGQRFAEEWRARSIEVGLFSEAFGEANILAWPDDDQKGQTRFHDIETEITGRIFEEIRSAVVEAFVRVASKVLPRERGR